MRIKIIFTIIAVFLLSLGIAAQSIYTPERGSPERKAIMDALRVPVEKELKQKIIFAADNFNVTGNWAFIGGTPQTPTGDRPDYSRTVHLGAQQAGAFDNNIFALLHKIGDQWKVVKYMIGCTDVCYLDWWKHYKAPKAIFPGAE